jgi:hypothetical protein
VNGLKWGGREITGAKRAITYMAVVPIGEGEDVSSASLPVNGFWAGAESFCGRCWTALVTFASHAPLDPWGFRTWIGMGVIANNSC